MGFINYFGLQRFGTNAHVPTHLVGVALLRRDFLAALRLVLAPSTPGLKNAVKAALAAFVARVDEPLTAAREALKRLPERGGTGLQRRLLRAFVAHAGNMNASTTAATACPTSHSDLDAAASAALRSLPRRSLMLYFNAFQATPCNTVYHHVVPCTTVYQRVPPCTTMYHRVPARNTM